MSALGQNRPSSWIFLDMQPRVFDEDVLPWFGAELTVIQVSP